MRRVAFRKKKQNKLAMLSITLVIMMLAGVFAVNGYSLKQKQKEYIAKEEQLQAEIDKETERTEELVELKKYTKTKKYAEEVAKDKLGLVYDDEIVFKPEE